MMQFVKRLKEEKELFRKKKRGRKRLRQKLRFNIFFLFFLNIFIFYVCLGQTVWFHLLIVLKGRRGSEEIVFKFLLWNLSFPCKFFHPFIWPNMLDAIKSFWLHYLFYAWLALLPFFNFQIILQRQVRIEAERAAAAKSAALEAERKAAEEAAKQKTTVDIQSASTGVAENSSKGTGLPQGSTPQVTENRQSAGILHFDIVLSFFVTFVFMCHTIKNTNKTQPGSFNYI